MMIEKGSGAPFTRPLGCSRPRHIPRRGDDEAADGDRAELRLRARRPVLVLDIDGCDEQMAPEGLGKGAGGGVARFSAGEKRAQWR